LATTFLSTINGVAPYGPASLAGVTKGSSTVAAAAVQVELNTTICPNLSLSDALAQLQAIENYMRVNAATIGLIIP
jgi:hypothetical protein